MGVKNQLQHAIYYTTYFCWLSKFSPPLYFCWANRLRQLYSSLSATLSPLVQSHTRTLVGLLLPVSRYTLLYPCLALAGGSFLPYLAVLQVFRWPSLPHCRAVPGGPPGSCGFRHGVAIFGATLPGEQGPPPYGQPVALAITFAVAPSPRQASSGCGSQPGAAVLGDRGAPPYGQPHYRSAGRHGPSPNSPARSPSSQIAATNGVNRF